MFLYCLLTYLLVISLTWRTTIASTLPRRSAPLSRGGARVRRAHSGSYTETDTLLHVFSVGTQA